MNTLVKICGIRTLKAAQISVEAGADFLGFNFVPTSKRYISPVDAKAIIQKLPKTISIVGVFQNESVDFVNTIISNLDLQFVQLHGEENQQFIKNIRGANVIKAFRLPQKFSTQKTVELLRQFSCSYFLLDRQIQSNGPMLDVDRVKIITTQFPIILAGGLTPENVHTAIFKGMPHGVDVASGIETDGKEDLQKIRQFVQGVKGI